MATWVRGELIITGYSPDGDSVRFRPEELATLKRLDGAGRLDPSEKDGSVQLRLDAIDTPESHYQNEAQPLADEARDTLLTALGFTDVRYDGETVSASTPDRVPAAVAATLVEKNGRPVALLYVGDRATSHADGDTVELDADLVDASANAEQTRNGRAYLTLYTTTPEPVRARFVELARQAQDVAGSVWKADRSAGFTLRTQADIGPTGALVLPKLFRRATDYLASTSKQSFDSWLADQGADNDPVEVAGQRTTLSALVTEDGDTVTLGASLLDLVFVE